MGNKDKNRDGDTATSTEANRDHSRDQEARDTTLARTITEAVARETQSIAKVFTRQLEKAMHNTRTYLRKVAQPPYQLPLMSLLYQMALK